MKQKSMPVVRPCLSLLFLILASVQRGEAFGVIPPSSCFAASSSRLGYSASEDSVPQRDVYGLERARYCAEQRFMSSPGLIGSGKERSDLLLTASLLKTRQLEIQLLETLNDSNAAVDELIHLWTTERGEQHARSMMDMQEKSSAGLVEEEARLFEMIKDHPRWAEPFARLATLYYCRGQPADAHSMAAKAVELKPWHFEASQLILFIAQQASDALQEEYWNSLALPPLTGTNENRRRWVACAVTQAESKLEESRQVTVEWLAHGQNGAFI